MRKIETRLLAAVLAGAVGAFAITAANADSQPEPTAPVSVVGVAVPHAVVQAVEPVAVRSDGERRA